MNGREIKGELRRTGDRLARLETWAKTLLEARQHFLLQGDDRGLWAVSRIEQGVAAGTECPIYPGLSEGFNSSMPGLDRCEREIKLLRERRTLLESELQKVAGEEQIAAARQEIETLCESSRKATESFEANWPKFMDILEQAANVASDLDAARRTVREARNTITSTVDAVGLDDDVKLPKMPNPQHDESRLALAIAQIIESVAPKNGAIERGVAGRVEKLRRATTSSVGSSY